MKIEVNGKIHNIFELTQLKSIGACERKYYELKNKYGNAACGVNMNSGIYTVFGFTYGEETNS